jgi:signal peptidase I
VKRFLIVFLVLVVVVLAVLKLFIYELPRVAGNDMAPALQPGDLLLANRLDTSPARGDLILLEHPSVPNRLLIRRVVGLPGESVAVHSEVPTINGKPARRSVLKDVTLIDGGEERAMKLIKEAAPDGRSWQVLKDPGRRSRDSKTIRLGSEQVYVMADNRNHGTDSRTFGPVPADKIRALITHRVSAGPGSIKGQPEREGWHGLRK